MAKILQILILCMGINGFVPVVYGSDIITKDTIVLSSFVNKKYLTQIINNVK